MTAGEEEDDPYTDPQTGTLRNKLGIADPATLAEVEADPAFDFLPVHRL